MNANMDVTVVVFFRCLCPTAKFGYQFNRTKQDEE